MREKDLSHGWEFAQKKEYVLEMYDYKCASCKCEGNLEIHHIVPLFLGGTNEETNLVPLCHQCHMAAHCGQHMSHYADHTNAGSKPNLSDEKAKIIFDKYFLGEIGTADLKKEFGWSDSYKIGASPQFKKYLEENDIKRYRNNVDVVQKNGYLYSGRTVGYVVYTNGERVDMIYP